MNFVVFAQWTTFLHPWDLFALVFSRKTYILSRNLVVLAFIGTIYIPLGNLIIFYWDDVHPFKESYHLLFE